LLKAIEGYNGHPTFHNALRIAPYLFVRPGELKNAIWEAFHLEKAVWNFKPSKKGLPFEFPLSKQVIEILKEQKQICGNGPYVFPSTRSNFRPISDNTLNAALHRMDYKGKTTIHGFRAMARTVIAERLDFPAEIIEMQLSHNVKDSLGRAYNRTTHFKLRRKMMDEWAGFLDNLKRQRRSS
jgi:integrase